MFYRSVAYFTCASFFLTSSPARGCLLDDERSPAVAAPTSTPAYCGIYSLYGALNAVGLRCEFRDLVSTDIVTSPFGSSIEDLKRAAVQRGAYAEPLVNMSAADLQETRCPLILHFADELRIGTYNHWVLYLGAQEGLARIVDAPHSLELMRFSELLARWDSTALVISADPVDTMPYRSRRWLAAALSTLLAATLGSIGWHRGWPRSSVRILLQAIAIVLASCAAGAGFNLFARDGMLRSDHAVQLVQQSYMPSDLDEISIENLVELKRTNRVIIVDARFQQAFERGHIPDAINIPVTASRTERSALLDGVPRRKQIVVYCRNERCGYAEVVGRALQIDGYQNVKLYRAGWRMWSSRHKED